MTSPHLDPKAPVQATAAAAASATPQAVWSVLADLPSWSTVYPELRELEADGPAAVGAGFHFKSGPMHIEATVTACETERLLAFEGKGKGASSQYVFALIPDGDVTRIEAAQSMAGLAVKTMRPMLQMIADTSLQDWTDAIARTAEGA